MDLEKGKYVVSSDLHGLMTRWSRTSSFSLPHDSFFWAMAKDLESVLAGYYQEKLEIVSEIELRSGLNSLAKKSKNPIVSLDRAYVDKETPNLVYFLDVTRAVDENLEDIGLFPRPGSPSLDQQLKTISYGNGPITLLDDVVFSGKGIVGLALEFERRGRPVKQVIIGVGVSEGIDKLKALGIETACVREYESVIDEVCERDYYAGVPMSGRTVLSSNGQTGSAPYFKPFGDPGKWASIPTDRIPDFSKFCLTQSHVLWAAIEKISQSSISTQALPRRIFGIQENVSIVRILKEHIDNHAQLI